MTESEKTDRGIRFLGGLSKLFFKVSFVGFIISVIELFLAMFLHAIGSFFGSVLLLGISMVLSWAEDDTKASKHK